MRGLAVCVTVVGVSAPVCGCVGAGCPEAFVRVNGRAHFIYNSSNARSTMSHLLVCFKSPSDYERIPYVLSKFRIILYFRISAYLLVLHSVLY